MNVNILRGIFVVAAAYFLWSIPGWWVHYWDWMASATDLFTVTREDPHGYLHGMDSLVATVIGLFVLFVIMLVVAILFSTIFPRSLSGNRDHFRS